MKRMLYKVFKNTNLYQLFRRDTKYKYKSWLWRKRGQIVKEAKAVEEGHT